MAKGEWLKNIFLSNRAVGCIVAAVGSILMVFPPTAGAGAIILPAGLGMIGVGGVNKLKRMDEEKKVVEDKVESKIN